MEEKQMDNLIQEFNNLSRKLIELTPGTAEYTNTLSAAERIYKLLLDDERFQSEVFDRNRRFDLEEEKTEVTRLEAVQRSKSGKREIMWKLMQAGFSVIGAVLCIILTAYFGQFQILDSKWLSFLKWFFPRMM